MSAVLVAVLLPAGPAHGAVITVTAMEDDIDEDDDNCSLREAVRATSFNFAVDECLAGESATTDTIQLPDGTATLMAVGADNDSIAGDLDLVEGVIFQGTGAAHSVVQAGTMGGGSSNGIDRVFDILTAQAVEFHDMTIRNGLTSTNGGGIKREQNGPVTLDNVNLVGNKATGDGGGLYINGVLTINESTINGNIAGGHGGGVWVQENVTVDRSTFSTNQSGGSGGGLYALAGLSSANSTFSGNSAAGVGGGVYGDDHSIAFNLVHTTVANNTADSDDGLAGAGGGLYMQGHGGLPETKKLTNSIVADNHSGVAFPLPDDCAGPFTSGGGNVVETTPTCITPEASDATGVDPALGLLEDNGGSTLTHAVLTGPAMDRGVAASCTGEDQRGLIRPMDAATDIDTVAECESGAYEAVPVAVSNTEQEEDDGSSPTSATVDVELPTDAVEDVVLNYETQDGTATFGEDYVAEAGELTIDEGTSSEPISVELIEDEVDEANFETFKVVITMAFDSTAVDPEGTVRLEDNDVDKVARTITLSLKKHLKAAGSVSAPDGPEKCKKGVPVVVQRKKGGAWKKVVEKTTSPKGNFSSTLPDKVGTYRARAVTESIDSAGGGVTCQQKTSATKAHKH